MGNQQERSLSWLAGILDGEGSISFQVYTLPNGRIRITPFVCVVNSDKGILDESFRILNELTKDSTDARPRWCNSGHGGPKSFASNKVCKTIRLDGVAVRFVLEPVQHFLFSSKKNAAQVVLKYLDMRDKRLLKRDARGRIERQGYTREEVELVSSIRSHSLAKSSEAICLAPNVSLG